MKTILKYHFEITDRVTIPMPAGADVYAVQVQDGRPTLWARVNTARPAELRRFCICGTGYNCETATGTYVGTIQLDGLTWHVFEATGEVTP